MVCSDSCHDSPLPSTDALAYLNLISDGAESLIDAVEISFRPVDTITSNLGEAPSSTITRH